MHRMRLLVPEDWQAWRDLRLEGLRNAPSAFLSSWADESIYSEDDWRRRIARNQIFAGFDVQESLLGGIGFYQMTATNLRHRGMMWGVYLRPAARGTGLANALMETMLEHAKSCVLQVHCGVDPDNAPARKLYERHGFIPCGTEPRALKIDETYYDELLMVKFLDGAT